LRLHKDQPVKFIVSSSVVLPVEPIGPEHFEERLALDSWSGYPRSLVELLQFIKTEKIHGVVFLSGDAHLSMACKLVLDGCPAVAVHSVVSSGMYTPWPFVNGRPEDYRLTGRLNLTCDDVAVSGTMTESRVSTHAGYAAVTFVPMVGDTGSPKLRVEFRYCDGNSPVVDYDLR
jgi:hypothetical protein